jgi:hypothetical protein
LDILVVQAAALVLVGLPEKLEAVHLVKEIAAAMALLVAEVAVAAVLVLLVAMGQLVTVVLD